MLLLTFQAAGQVYAIEAARIVEVVPRLNLRPLPHAQPFLAGVFEYRGAVVPAVDLGVLLGAGPAADRLSTRIVVVDRDAETRSGAFAAAPNPSRRRSLLGVVAEQVDDLASVDPGALTAPPVPNPRAPYLGPIAETPRGLVQLIAVERVLEESSAD